MKVLIVILFVIVVGVFIVRLYFGHQCIRELDDMKTSFNSLYTMLHYVASDKNENPPTTINGIAHWLSNYQNFLVLLSSTTQFKIDSQNNTISDIWGTPIELVYTAPDEYKFISAGPNKKYEHGKGDDIVCVYRYKASEKQPEQ